MVPQSGSSTSREVAGAMMKIPVWKEAKLSLGHLQSGRPLLNILVDSSATIRQPTLTSTTGIWLMLNTVMVPHLLEMCKLSISLCNFSWELNINYFQDSEPS